MTNKQLNGFTYMIITGAVFSCIHYIDSLLIAPVLLVVILATYRRANAFDWPLRGRVITTVLISLLYLLLFIDKNLPDLIESKEFIEYMALPAVILEVVLIFKNANVDKA